MAVINKGYNKSNGTSNYSKYYGSNKYSKASTLKTLPTIGPSNSIGNTTLGNTNKNYSKYDVAYAVPNLAKKVMDTTKEAINKAINTKSSTNSGSNKGSSGSGSGYSYSSGGGGGASAPVANAYAIDLTDILNSYTASAEAQKQSIMGVTSAQQKFYEDALKSAIEELKLSEKSQRETL